MKVAKMGASWFLTESITKNYSEREREREKDKGQRSKSQTNLISNEHWMLNANLKQGWELEEEGKRQREEKDKNET